MDYGIWFKTSNKQNYYGNFQSSNLFFNSLFGQICQEVHLRFQQQRTGVLISKKIGKNI